MSEPIPESIPTSTSHRSSRPAKKLRPNTPTTQQSAQLSALFANPDIPITLPTSNPKQQSGLSAPPEIVANVQGSSAGAGSGEFHVYKASRRREYERLRLMDEEVEREEREKEFREKQEERRREDEERLERNRGKRAKVRARREKKKGGWGGVAGEGEGMEVDGGVKKQKLGPAKVRFARKEVGEEDGEAGGGNGIANGNGEAMVEEGGGITIHDDD